ncbi:DUF4184 family protein [Streptomyces durbertensis]|uniref:DUF4184 family protein n=1 Tax=Streptomyces durbertensis TaxID=2448886 RepID=A0ABR6EK19_9ACTN|nr:DUF4184 family protein [Streptomyces durbertensis]MBB1245677.1 DUF4184 family protein [Streptomyces durbertensis]
MPFTLSHAAAALPGLRRDGTGRGPLVASALVAGTMAPDAVYFADSLLPGAMRLGATTHSAVGVLTVDVMTAGLLVLLWLWVRGPLLALLPAHRQARAYALLGPRTPGVRPGVRLLVCGYLSAALGAATHVVWDAFTHQGRWGVRALPFLDSTVAGFPGYSLAQYGSSAVALVVLTLFWRSAIRHLPAGGPPAGVPVLSRRARWTAVGLLVAAMLVGAVHRCLRWAAVSEVPLTPLDLIPTSLFGAGAGLAVALPLYAVVVRLRAPARTPVDPPAGTPSRAPGSEPAQAAAQPPGGRRSSSSVGSSDAS